jgi:hypothetical protein
MPHSWVGLSVLLLESLGGSPNATVRSLRARASLGCLAAELLRPHGCEMLGGSYSPKWSDQDALTNLLAALLVLRRAIGDLIATLSFFHLNPASVQFNVYSDSWNYSSRGAAYARS